MWHIYSVTFFINRKVLENIVKKKNRRDQNNIKTIESGKIKNHFLIG